MIAAIIQARATSTRLPNKVLMDLTPGKSMLWHLIERLKESKTINEIILAVPDSKENDILEYFAKENGLKYFRGSEDNVLSRYFRAANEFRADVIIRITSDCPLIDPKIVDKVVRKHLESGADYTSNIQSRTYPKGMDIEVFNFSTLKKAFSEAIEQSDKEHVTLYIRRNLGIFKQTIVVNEKDLSDFRWTVDEKEDLDFIREVYKRLYPIKKIFLMEDVVEFLQKEPKISEINRNIRRKKI
jgi:spore coat polysaccharide biosynthesis protein SpsF